MIEAWVFFGFIAIVIGATLLGWLEYRDQKQRACALWLLRDGEMLGQELVEASDGVLGRGTIYGLLSRLEDEGLVESWPEPAATTEDRMRIIQAAFRGDPCPRRRLYRLTLQGHKSSRRWPESNKGE